MKKLTNILLLALGVFAGCSSEGAPEVANVPAPELNIMEKAAAEEVCGFDLDFFKAMNVDYSGKNIVVSPLSASMNLSLLANMADSDTRAELCDVLGSTDVAALNSLTAKYMSWLPAADSHVGLKLANSVWYDNHYSLKSAFSDVAGQYYSAELFGRDFSEASLANEINGWVSDKTAGLIGNIVDAEKLKALVAMNINTLYFKGEWSQAFNADKTITARFNGADGVASVPMMKDQRELSYAYAEEFEAVELDFGNSMFSTILVLPAAESDIDGFIASDGLASIKNARWKLAGVDLSLPRFKIVSDEMDVIKALKALGIVNADKMFIDGLFDSNMPNMVSNISQKTSVEFSEKGAEAAAVTWDGFFGSASPSENVSLTFDRPFIFLIRENHTGRCLFAGKIVNL